MPISHLQLLPPGCSPAIANQTQSELVVHDLGPCSAADAAATAKIAAAAVQIVLNPAGESMHGGAAAVTEDITAAREMVFGCGSVILSGRLSIDHVRNTRFTRTHTDPRRVQAQYAETEDGPMLFTLHRHARRRSERPHQTIKQGVLPPGAPARHSLRQMGPHFEAVKKALMVSLYSVRQKFDS